MRGRDERAESVEDVGNHAVGGVKVALRDVIPNLVDAVDIKMIVARPSRLAA